MTERVIFFFEVHQPRRLKKLFDFSPANMPERLEDMFDDAANDGILDRVVRKAYMPASRALYESLSRLKGYRVTMSFSGLLLEAVRRRHPDLLRLWQDMVSKGMVEPSAQTYYHSLAWLIDRSEFREQVRMQAELIEELFGVKPSVAENTEFIYNNDIGCELYDMGFKTVMTEGFGDILGWRSPNYVYSNPLCPVKLLLRNYMLSDDIGFRFSNRSWVGFPLTADKYSQWVRDTPGDLVVVALDYETFGEHHWPETGIHEFLRWLPIELSKRGVRMISASDAASELEVKDYVDVPPWRTISWADERDLSAWTGNPMQAEALRELRRMYYFARALGGEVLSYWRLMSISDHFYYMATKMGPTGEVHSYFSHLGSAYQAYATYSMALHSLAIKIRDGLHTDPCAALRVMLPDELCFRLPQGRQLCSIKELREVVGNIRELEESIGRWLSDVFGLSINDVVRLENHCRS